MGKRLCKFKQIIPIIIVVWARSAQNGGALPEHDDYRVDNQAMAKRTWARYQHFQQTLPTVLEQKTTPFEGWSARRPTLIHVEHLGQRDGDGGVVGVDLHDVGHIVPPFLYDFGVAQILGAGVALHLLICEQDVGLLVPID